MKDLIFITKNTFKDLISAIKKGGWIFIPVYILVELIFIGIVNIIPNQMILSSIIYYILYLLKLTIYAKCLNEIIYTDRLKIGNIRTNIMNYFVNIMNTFFYVYVIKIAVGIISTPFSMGMSDHHIYFTMIIFEFILENILFGALFETVYVDNYGGLDAFKRAISFFIKNIVPWTVLNLPYFAYLMLNSMYDKNIIKTNKILFVLNIILPPIFLMFKGKLYKILSNSSKRKREFMNEYNR